MQNKGIIYALKFPNGKVYIGQTWNIENRHRASGSMYKKSLVGKTIKKYGWNNIEKIILRDGIETDKEMDNIEIDYIAIYCSWNRDCGYNETMGGKGGRLRGWKHTEESKRKMGDSSRTRIQSPEQRRKNSESKKGKPRSPEMIEKMRKSLTGRKLSEECKRKLSESHKGRKLSEETRRKISENQKGKSHYISEKDKIRLRLYNEMRYNKLEIHTEEFEKVIIELRNRIQPI